MHMHVKPPKKPQKSYPPTRLSTQIANVFITAFTTDSGQLYKQKTDNDSYNDSYINKRKSLL